MAKKEKKESNKKEVTIKCHNAPGKYLLPFNYGQKVELEKKQADEMIESGDAE